METTILVITILLALAATAIGSYREYERNLAAEQAAQARVEAEAMENDLRVLQMLKERRCRHLTDDRIAELMLETMPPAALVAAACDGGDLVKVKKDLLHIYYHAPRR